MQPLFAARSKVLIHAATAAATYNVDTSAAGG